MTSTVYSHFYGKSKEAELIETKWNAGCQGWGCQETRGMLVKGYRLSSRMNKFWGSYVQRADDSYQYCVIQLKFPKREGYKCSHHKKKKAIK